MATGLGKTPTFACLKRNIGLRKRQLVVAHREELIEQAVAKLRVWNPGARVGIDKAERRPSPDDEFVVASVQTIGRKGHPRLLAYDPSEFDGLVVDEAHHSVADSYRAIFEHFQVFQRRDILLLGVTATPNRADGRAMAEIYEEIPYTYGILPGIRDGWLANLRGIRVRTTTDLSDVHSRGGDFIPDELVTAINTPERNELLVRSWFQYGMSLPTLVFSGRSIQHAKDIAEMARRYGIAAEAVWGDDPHRAEKLRYHREGQLQWIVNVELLTEGYDDWRIGCMILARPTQSEGLYTQMLGRGTRLPEGIGNLHEARQQGVSVTKDECIVIDTVDNSRRHSLVTLPNLFGLNNAFDLEGRQITAVMDEVEEILDEHPEVDLTGATSARSLRAYAESVDLFKVSYPPEILQISDFQWHRQREDAYILMLTGRDSVSVMQDALGWFIHGYATNNAGTRFEIMKHRPTLEEAIREADYQVKLLGARAQVSNAKMNAPWHSLPPSEYQIMRCAEEGITIPPGATRGDVQKKLNQLTVARRREGSVA